MLVAQAAEGWMMSLSAVGFDIGQPADQDLVELMEQAIAELPADELRYHVRIRSMLTSVLVPEHDPTRRLQLAEEAMAIATLGDDDELVASALLARRLARWQLDALDERLELILESVDRAHRSGNVQLELTAMLFALSDLLEAGRMSEHLAMLDEFAARAAELHLPLFETYGRFQRASHALSAGDFAEARRLADDALATGRRSHGVNAEIAYAGVWFRLALDLGRLPETLPESERMLAANPRLRMWQIAVVRALVETDRIDDARAHFEDLVGPDAVNMRDNQMFLPATAALAEVALAVGDPVRAAVVQRALEPYVERIATSGLAGISIGPVSGYAGIAALAAGDLDAAERHLSDAIERNVAHGTRPHEARARLALARVHRARGDAPAAAAEEAAARSIAAEIGLALG
jgi:tetratricopeptide (TPR) repeat protein